MSGIFYPSESEQSESEKKNKSQSISKLLYLLFTEFLHDESTNEDLRKKLHDTILHYKVKQSTKIVSQTGIVYDILGLSNIETPKFTFEEENILMDMVNERMSYYVNKQKPHKKGESISDKLLLQSRENLNKIMTTYADNLLECQQILDSMKDTQLTDLPILCSEKKEDVEVKVNVNNAKCDLIDATGQLKILTETEVSSAAYKEIVQLIKREQEQYKIKIADLKEEQMKYQMFDCKEYQDILKEYLQYDNYIQKIYRMQTILGKK